MKAKRLCPICETAAPVPAYAPFCSRRCADVDLQRWFVGRYAVPGRPTSPQGGGTADEAED